MVWHKGILYKSTNLDVIFFRYLANLVFKFYCSLFSKICENEYFLLPNPELNIKKYICPYYRNTIKTSETSLGFSSYRFRFQRFYCKISLSIFNTVELTKTESVKRRKLITEILNFRVCVLVVTIAYIVFRQYGSYIFIFKTEFRYKQIMFT